ncbi:periplasmic nitrate reductase, NapE protein [Dyella koreensis]|uniref:Periplasmic nitrate reductase, NapE protein n=1 Tax=Dyella koreensis TaxID=311235 RepID=A0ABW8K2D1_9GAMM
MESSPEISQKPWERTVFLVLTVALFPILAVAIVASYGFAIWIWQMLLSGPPGS